MSAAPWIIRLGSVVCIASVVVGCQSDDPVGSVPGEEFIAFAKPAERIGFLVKAWFRLIEEPSHVSPDLMDFLGHEDVVFRSNDETIRGRTEIFDWAAEASLGFARVEFQIGPIEILGEDEALFRARFDVDRRVWDEEGLLHLSRARHSWLIGVEQKNRLQLLDAVERGVLFHPGTGSQILCL